MRSKVLFIVFLTVALIPCVVLSQNFSRVDAGFPVARKPAAAWADVDNDGDLDAFISGMDENSFPVSDVFRNDGVTFSPFSTSITGLYSGSCAFGDYNNDGLADLLVSGTNGSAKYTLLYRNDGGGTFTDIGAGLAGVTDGDVAWGDINNDGWADLVISGENSSGQTVCILYINNEGNSFTDAGAGFIGHMKGELAFSDLDLDGDMDLAINGIDNSQNPSTIIYINTDGNFAQMGAGITGLSEATLAWGDFNNDSWPDLLISGAGVNKDPVTLVYKNNAGFSFSALTGSFNGILNGSAIWGDFNNDGKLDFIIGGKQVLDGGGLPPMPDIPAKLQIYHNLGNEQFQMQEIQLNGVENNEIECGDYDNDSDLDLLLSGEISNSIGEINVNAVIYRNETANSNSPPSAPAGLSYIISGNDISLSWNPSTDDKTPSTGLNYNLRIGSSDVNMDVMSAHASLNTGYRRIVAAGNTAANTSWDVLDLDFGEYYASVQAIDPSYGGSAFSASVSIELLPTATFALVDFACVNDEVLITYTGNAPSSAQYDWGFDGGTANPGIGQGPQSVIWDTEGIKTVSLSVTINGVSSDPVYMDISIVVPPIADAGADQSIPPETSTQLSGSASGGSGSYTYYWMPDSLLVNPAQPDPTTIPLLESVHFFMEVTDTESGCTAYDDMIVNVFGGPLNLTVSADPDSICEGDSTQLLALAGGGSGNYSYSWSSTPPGFTSNDPDPVAYPAVTTLYFAELSDGTEILTDSVLVAVAPLPASAGSISGPEEICTGSEQVLYEINIVPGATVYFWELSEGLSGSSTTNTIFVNFPEIVSDAVIKVNPANDCGLGQSSSIEIEMISFPDTPVMPYGPDSICTTTDTIGQYQISEAVTGASSYEWELLPEDAGTIEGEGMTADVHWVKNWTGQASIRIRALNDCGISYWSETLNVHLFNCLGINDFGNDDIEISVYPNPANEVLGVRCYVLGEEVQFDLYLYDLYGRAVEETTHPGKGVIEINTSDISAGMYILSLQAKNGLKVSKKVLIQH